MATLPQVTHPQAERVKRPSLTFSGSTLEQEDFEHFKHLFSLYKERLGGNQDNAKLLNDCLATDVSRAVFSSLGPAMSSMSETDLMDAISTCCVTKQTLQARNADFYRTKQDTGQTVQNFLSALKLKV